jgi:hypothetical protein
MPGVARQDVAWTGAEGGLLLLSFLSGLLAAAGSPAAQPVSTGKKNVRVFENGFEIHNSKMGDPHGKLAKGGKTVKVRCAGFKTGEEGAGSAWCSGFAGPTSCQVVSSVSLCLTGKKSATGVMCGFCG